MACPAALIPCRGINSVRTWSRSLLTLCIQATSTANHLAKEIGRDQRPAKSAEKQTMSLRSEVSLSCRNLWTVGGGGHRRFSRRLHGSQWLRSTQDQNVLPTSTTTTSHDGVWGQASVTNDFVPFMTWITGSSLMAYWKVASPSKECENKSQNVEIKWLYFDLYTPRLPVHWMTKSYP